MKILLIHTFYTKKGGEDAVLESEYQLLSEKNEVETLTFDNTAFNKKRTIEIFGQSIFNKNAALALRNKIKSFKPDIIHVHNFFYEASPSIFYEASKMNIPIVMTLHNFRLICIKALLLRNNQICELCVHGKLPLYGIKYKCFQNSYLKSIQLTLITGIHKLLGTWKNKVNKYIVFTDFLKKRFLDSSLQLEPNQVFIKPNFVLDHGFNTGKRMEYFLFVGRLSKEKGIEILLKACELGNFKLEIIGGGELQAVVEEYCSKNENITYHGFQEKEFIINKMKNAKALIFPSLWYEGMPITILESLSTGTPIIISNKDNLKDMIEDQVDGLHFNAGDPNDLISKINNFEKVDSTAFYNNARESYLKKYSPEVNYNLLMKIYNESIQENMH